MLKFQPAPVCKRLTLQVVACPTPSPQSTDHDRLSLSKSVAEREKLITCPGVIFAGTEETETMVGALFIIVGVVVVHTVPFHT